MLYNVDSQRFRGFLKKGAVPARIQVVLYAGRFVPLTVQPHEVVSDLIRRVWFRIAAQSDLRLQFAEDSRHYRTFLVHHGPLLATKTLFQQGVFDGAFMWFVRRRKDAEPVQVWPDACCRNCGAYPADGAPKFSRCETCRGFNSAVRYCSNACQTADWRHHKHHCQGRKQ